MNAMFDVIFKVVAVALMGANAVGFVTNKTEASKYDDKPIIERVSVVENRQGVIANRVDNHDKLFETIEKSLDKINNKLDDLGGWNNPAVSAIPTNAPLVKGVNKNGTPKN